MKNTFGLQVPVGVENARSAKIEGRGKLTPSKKKII